MQTNDGVTRIAVTGAGGWIGGRVCKCLENAGFAVRRFGGHDSAGIVGVDLAEASCIEMLVRGFDGCDAVIHCAARVHRSERSRAHDALCGAVNIEGTDRVLRACAAAGVQRFVFASTIAVYDWTEGPTPRGEESRILPASTYGQSKAAAEELVRTKSPDWRIARLSTVYGDGDCANFGRLAHALKTRRFLLPDEGGARKSVLPVDRAAEMLARLAVMRGGSKTVVNLAAPQAPSLLEICNAFCDAFGFPRPWRFPRRLLRIAAAAGDRTSALGLPSPLTTDVVRKLTSDTVVEVGRMQALFPSLTWPPFVDSLRCSCSSYGRAA